MRILLFALILAVVARADGPGVIRSAYSKKDFALTADPAAKQWKGVKPVVAELDHFSKPVPGHRTEIRARWTKDNLYFLFVCPYEELFLKDNPSLTTETNKLWNWDVAEVFVGADFKNIRHYRELQLSPQGEWVDLDIDRDKPNPEGGWLWNSGFQVKARIDRDKKIWYGEMQIPIRSIDARPAKAGHQMRINFYRIQGPPSARRMLCWQPTGARNNHMPEAFGRIELVK
jgi:hypothetical protein